MSVPSWRRNAQLFAALPKSTSTIGLFVRDENGRGRVRIGDGEIVVRYATRFRPRKGEGVVLTFFGNQVRITGPTAAKNSVGQVAAVQTAQGTLLVQVDTKFYTLPYTQSYENTTNTSGGLGPLVNDTVTINWDGTAYVADKLTSTPVEADVPPLTSSQKPFKRVFSPTQSGSYKTTPGKWNGKHADLFCDSHHAAAWFYGSRMKTFLRNAGLIESVEIYLSLRTKKGVQPTIGRHYDASEQSSGVSLNDGDQRGWKGWIRLPVDWAEDWRTDTGGVAISGGSSVYRGIGTDHQSGRIRITGRQ